MDILKPYFENSVVAYFNMQYSSSEDESWIDTDNAFGGFVIGFEQAAEYIKECKKNISQFYLEVFGDIWEKNKLRVLPFFNISEKEYENLSIEASKEIDFKINEQTLFEISSLTDISFTVVIKTYTGKTFKDVFSGISCPSESEMIDIVRQSTGKHYIKLDRYLNVIGIYSEFLYDVNDPYTFKDLEWMPGDYADW